jgi:hypothetical protein
MQLHEYPFDRVRVACEKCERSGEYRKIRLTEMYGADIDLPALLDKIAIDCPRQGIQSVAMDPCGVQYPDLRGSVHLNASFRRKNRKPRRKMDMPNE